MEIICERSRGEKLVFYNKQFMLFVALGIGNHVVVMHRTRFLKSQIQVRNRRNNKEETTSLFK